MDYAPDIHHRHSIRLQGYDYSRAAAYFITLCTQNRACLFGQIINATMQMSDVGRIVADEWLKTADIRSEIKLDEWVLMPNHFHGIVVITDEMTDHSLHGCRGDRPVAPTGPQPRSIGAIMAGFKSAVTKRVNALQQTPGTKLWQRNYWEHIIRNEQELNRIRDYIRNNPTHWEIDRLNTHGASGHKLIQESANDYTAEPWMV